MREFKSGSVLRGEKKRIVLGFSMLIIVSKYFIILFEAIYRLCFLNFSKAFFLIFFYLFS
jgi:hypothetical protein